MERALAEARWRQPEPARAVAWARCPRLRPRLRLNAGDSRSPDKISVTPGSLCRSGCTSPTIAQSQVLVCQYFKPGPK
jgi:hypothetical protein